MYFQPETKKTFHSHSEFRSAFSDTSFPVELTDEIMQAFGVFPVTKVEPSYDLTTQGVQEIAPVLVDGVYVQQWEIVVLSEEEIARRHEAQAAQVRAERKQKLAETDWTQLADAPVDKQAWATYRQTLRDITAQPGFPWDITWPSQPE